VVLAIIFYVSFLLGYLMLERASLLFSPLIVHKPNKNQLAYLHYFVSCGIMRFKAVHPYPCLSTRLGSQTKGRTGRWPG
jgi:hypothetical protein